MSRRILNLFGRLSRVQRALPGLVALAVAVSSASPSAFHAAITFDDPHVATWVGQKTAFADYDHDGDVDVLTRIQYQNFLYLSTNMGNGTFAQDQIGSADSAIFADVNGDGWVDIVTASTSAGLQVRLNDHGGWFTNVQTIANSDFAPAQAMWDVVAADVDHDGDLDLMTSSYRTNERFNLLLNDGTGHFSMGWQSPAIPGIETVFIGFADLNGDGFADFVALGNNKDSNIWINDQHGAFLGAEAFSGTEEGWCAGIGHQSAAIADVNGDGRNDLVIKEYQWAPACADGFMRTSWYENTGDMNHFVRHDITAATGGDTGSGIAVGDLDGDGDVDLVASNGVNNATLQPSAFENDGHGNFTLAAWASPVNRADGYQVWANDFFLHDMNGDGKLDLMTSGYYGGLAFYNVTVGGGPTDTTPPAIAATVTGTIGNNGWYTSDVTVTWTVTDGESAATSTGCAAQSVTADTAGVTFTCAATSDGGSASQSVTIKRDATRPTISSTRTPAANVNGWNSTNVAVNFTCADALSGMASCAGNTTVSTEGAGQLVTGTATDLAGNQAFADVSPINIDKTAPAVSVTSPANGATFTLNQNVTAAYACTDALSGGATCVGSVAAGSVLNTASVGAKTFTVTSADAAGNTKTATVTYQVVYGFSFLQPTAGATIKAGEDLDVEFRLTTATGVSVRNAVATVSVNGGPSLGQAKADDGKYEFELKTKGLSAGSLTITVTLSDGTTHSVVVVLKAKHADGDKCDHELGKNGHKKNDGCDHERR